MIAITDVIEIQRISVRYKNPEFINKQINKIEKLKAEVSGKKAELVQWKEKSKIRIQQAKNARQTSLNIKDALKKNPMMKKYQRLDNLRSIIKNANPGMNTKVHLIQREMVSNAQYTYSTESGTQASKR